jgi:nucleoside-diphosphate-sugar epimerase
MYKQHSLLNCCSYENFNFINGDVCDSYLMKDYLLKNDIIIPLAAIVGAPASNRYYSLTKSINYYSNLELIKNISSNQLVIFPTTNSGYGKGDIDGFCDENSDLKPLSDYGKYKVEIEKRILDLGNSITFRLATVFGISPRMRTDLLVNDFVLKALKDRSIILFEEHFRRNFIHIMDVANTFEFAILNVNKMLGESFNVGLSSANLTKKELALKIKEHLPDTYIHSAEIGEDPDKRDYLVSNKKIEKLGWKAKNDLDYGIRELLKGYKILQTNSFSNA